MATTPPDYELATTETLRPVLFVPKGSEAAYAQTNPWSHYQIIVGTSTSEGTGLYGDVNGDGTVDIADVTEVVNVIVGKH